VHKKKKLTFVTVLTLQASGKNIFEKTAQIYELLCGEGCWKIYLEAAPTHRWGGG